LQSLDLDREPRFGLRQETLLANDVDQHIIDEGVRAFTSWADDRHAMLERASVPTLDVQRVTHLRRPIDIELPSVAIVDVPGAEANRPFGPQFGTLVHAILAATPLDADAAAVDAVAKLCGRILDSGELEVAAASTAVQAALAHPLLRRAADAEQRGACRRETPVTLTDAEGLIEGIVDLAFEENGEWIVVDFKTDTDIDAHQAEYEQQVGLYVTAVERATGARTRGVLLRV
jgi:ATP-dependent exoDNAse (exonuclease V) beta subunit